MSSLAFPAKCAALAIALACAAVAQAQTPSPAANWGTYTKLFSATSPWNSRPVNPVFDTTSVIPTDTFEPTVADGDYSTGIFQATAQDGPVTVYGPEGTSGISDPDSGGPRASITIPRWPAGVTPAAGTDGHADIVDTETGIIHSF